MRVRLQVFLDPSGEQSFAKSVVGSPMYLSPEIVNSEPSPRAGMRWVFFTLPQISRCMALRQVVDSEHAQQSINRLNP